MLSENAVAQTKVAACVDPTPATLAAGPGKWLEAGRSFVQAKNLDEAKHCAGIAAKAWPKDRDAAFFFIRIEAWQRHYHDAESHLQPWPAQDRESTEIRGDLAWYQSHWSEAESWYKKALDDKKPPKASAELWQKYIRCLEAQKHTDAAKAARQAALVEYPSDPAFKEPVAKAKPPAKQAAKPAPKSTPVAPKELTAEQAANRLWLSAFVTQYWESQDQTAQAGEVNATGRRSGVLGTTGVTSVSRRYPKDPATGRRQILVDRTYRLGVGYSFFKNHETTLLGAYTPAAHFTYKYQLKLRHEVVVKENTYGIEFGKVVYNDASFMVYNPYLIDMEGHWRYTLKLFITSGDTLTMAGLVDVAYVGAVWTPEIYLVDGRDDASRPYLTKAQKGSFTTGGVKLAWMFLQDASLVLGFERRIEQHFYQNSVTLGTIWIF